MTEFIETVELNDGYSGKKITAYLCRVIESGIVLAVYPFGFHTYHS